jgi:hypothetical protein
MGGGGDGKKRWKERKYKGERDERFEMERGRGGRKERVRSYRDSLTLSRPHAVGSLRVFT